MRIAFRYHEPPFVGRPDMLHSKDVSLSKLHARLRKQLFLHVLGVGADPCAFLEITGIIDDRDLGDSSDLRGKPCSL